VVVAARTLDEGAAWVQSRLGASLVPGGKHPTMGTHNRLLGLGPRTYLEVMAIDPDAAPPQRPRWFDLDSPAMAALLERGPALIHWAERTGDIEGAVRGDSTGLEIVAFSRGPYRWRMAIARDGRRPEGGAKPTLIQWDSDHPAAALPESGVRLERFTHENGALAAAFSTTAGMRTIP